MMPPPGKDRPDAATLGGVHDHARDAHRSDGRGPPQSRAAHVPAPEPRRVQRVRSATCSALDVDVGGVLPARHEERTTSTTSPTCSSLSPTLLDGYLRAASEDQPRSRSAIPKASASVDDLQGAAHRVAAATQVEGAPFGTRGGISVDRTRSRPTANTSSRSMLHAIPTGAALRLHRSAARRSRSRSTAQRVALLDIDPRHERVGSERREPCRRHPIAVTAGPQRVSAAFIQRVRRSGRRSDRPDRAHARRHADRQRDGITTLPHLRDLAVTGPYNVTGRVRHAEPPRIFTCRPTAPDEAAPCAREDRRRRWRRQAYRRPLTPSDLKALMTFYDEGAARAAIRSRHPHGARGDPRQPALHLPLRGDAGRAPKPGRTIASAISIWRRGCRSSSGRGPPDDELVVAAARGAC